MNNLKQFFCGLFDKHDVKMVVTNIDLLMLSTQIRTIKCMRCGKVFAMDSHTEVKPEKGDEDMKATTKCNAPKAKPKPKTSKK